MPPLQSERRISTESARDSETGPLLGSLLHSRRKTDQEQYRSFVDGSSPTPDVREKNLNLRFYRNEIPSQPDGDLVPARPLLLHDHCLGGLRLLGRAGGGDS